MDTKWTTVDKSETLQTVTDKTETDGPFKFDVVVIQKILPMRNMKHDYISVLMNLNVDANLHIIYLCYRIHIPLKRDPFLRKLPEMATGYHVRIL